MKKFILLFVFSISTVIYSQNESIIIDYTVDYLIPNKEGIKDTISIGYNMDGKFLWTNSTALAESLAKSMIPNPDLYKKANSNIIYNTTTKEIVMDINIDENQIFFKINIGLFIPKKGNVTNVEDMNLITESTDVTTKVLDKEVNIFTIYPEGKEIDQIEVAIDKDYKMNNNIIFQRLFEIAAIATGEKILSSDIPDGLILKIGDNNQTLIEAIKVNTTKKTININYSFKITE
ncbi:hypothetical protein [Winogradskyella sp.]|uniref:hypothetical protein n=1 Tax=Winogradskyella sp. TaxID=1883156 RepID=UPI0025F12602|nr:hypothetical protein [Winogradskyella sp.]